MDPRIVGPNPGKHAVLSPLMQAKARAGLGEKVNACPFGCQTEDLDDLGYCDHLVGFTTDGKTYEPMFTDDRGRKKVMGGQPRKVQPGDKLVQITVSSRVYREKADKKAPAA